MRSDMLALSKLLRLESDSGEFERGEEPIMNACSKELLPSLSKLKENFLR